MKLDELRKLAQAINIHRNPPTEELLQELIKNLGLDPRNIYQELEMTSPFVDTHRDTSSANAVLHLHSHTFYELLYCCNSCGAEYLVGSERYRLQQGDVVFIPPGISHRPLLPEYMAEPYMRYVLWLSPEFMEWYAGLFHYPFTGKQTHASLLRTGGTKCDHLGELFRVGVQEAEQRGDGWEASVIGNTMVLLTQIKRATDDRSARAMKAETPKLIDRITAYIEANYDSPITVGELARQFYVSNSTVSHLFREKMGVSICRYVTQRRLIAAKVLIEQGCLLEDVCTRVGFSDYSGFYRAFRQEYGISPRQYRSLQEASSKKIH